MNKERDIKLSLVKGTGAKIVGYKSLYQLLKLVVTDEGLIKSAKELKHLYKTDYPSYEKKKDFQGGFVIGNFSYRDQNSCTEYVPFLGFDIDKVKTEEETKRIFNLLKKWEYSFLLMPSVSGFGLRLIVVCESTKETHADVYVQLCEKISKIVSIPLKSSLRDAFKDLGYVGKGLKEQIDKHAHVDDSMKDISRFWYYSGLDRKEIFLNEESTVYKFREPIEIVYTPDVKKQSNYGKKEYDYKFTSSEKIEYAIEQIEKNGIDITSGLTDWFKVGLALAHEFGEMGRSYFHSVSKFHPDYDYKKNEKEFNRCLRKAKNNKVTIGSFYKYCSDYGVGFDWKELVQKHSHKFPNHNSKKTKKVIEVNKEIVEQSAKENFFLPEAERSIIGASLLNIELLQEAFEHCPKFSHECFVDEDNQKIFQAIQVLFSEGKGVSPISVNAKLREYSVDYLTQFTINNFYANQISTNVDIVYQAFLKRKMIGISNECLLELSNNEHDVFDYLDSMQSNLTSLGDYGGNSNEDTAHSAAMKVLERVTKAQEHFFNTGGKGLIGVPTGITALDEFTGGYQSPDLVILAARPGMGKTAFVLSTLLNAAKKGYPVGMFSLEMANEQLTMRLASVDSGVTGDKLKKGGLNDDEAERVGSSLEYLSGLPFYLDDTAGASISYVLRQATKWKRKYNIQLLIVDYIQLMSGTGNNREQEISSISRGLKLIAKKLKIPVIALSQLNRAVETRGGDKRPQLSDLRESGAIEQDADIVSFIYRPEYYQILEDEEGNSLKGTAEIIFAKHRSGALDTVHCSFDASTTKFYDGARYEPKTINESTTEDLDIPFVQPKKADEDILALFEIPENEEPKGKMKRGSDKHVEF